jgi:hypothetical protein
VSTVEQTRDELLQLLAEQRRFLAVSCAAFDAGDHAEAKRIATALRILLLDVGSSRPLLVRLGTRDQMEWLDTAGSMLPLEASAQTPLAFVSVEERLGQVGATWQPTLDAWDRRLQERPQLPPEVEEKLARMRADRSLRSRGLWLPFAEWWGSEVLRDQAGQSFTRADLVTALPDTHDEAGLDESYRRLTRPDSSGWAIRLETSPHVPPVSPALASMRQVAFEVERTLHRAAPLP